MLYNPFHATPERWLESPEELRVLSVKRFHLQTNCIPPDPGLHAAIHVIIENQVAEGFQPTVDALVRLREGGLDRHEAIHAIGGVVHPLILDVGTGQTTGDPNAYLPRHSTN